MKVTVLNRTKRVPLERSRRELRDFAKTKRDFARSREKKAVGHSATVIFADERRPSAEPHALRWACMG